MLRPHVLRRGAGVWQSEPNPAPQPRKAEPEAANPGRCSCRCGVGAFGCAIGIPERRWITCSCCCTEVVATSASLGRRAISDQVSSLPTTALPARRRLGHYKPNTGRATGHPDSGDDLRGIAFVLRRAARRLSDDQTRNRSDRNPFLTQAPRQGLHSIAEGLRHAITFASTIATSWSPALLKECLDCRLTS